MYECYLCGKKTVIWGADFDFEDYGYEGEGIVHTYRCQNCGADIEISEKFKEEEDD